MDSSESINEFFQAHVDRACRSVGVPAHPWTEDYLVHLLTAFAAQRIDDRPLALKLRDALDASPSERRTHLREIGDTSLYVSGFWSESFERRTIDVDYYIGMGESAYGELAGLAREPGRQVFNELAHNFGRFVRVLGSISEALMPSESARDIVRLYERWSTTGSEWARRRLAALGVMLPAAETPQ